MELGELAEKEEKFIDKGAGRGYNIDKLAKALTGGPRQRLCHINSWESTKKECFVNGYLF